MVDRLLEDGRTVFGWDNFSTGQEAFIADALKQPNLKLVRGDNLDLDALTMAMAGCDAEFHLAANADISGMILRWPTARSMAGTSVRAAVGS